MISPYVTNLLKRQRGRVVKVFALRSGHPGLKSLVHLVGCTFWDSYSGCSVLL